MAFINVPGLKGEGGEDARNQETQDQPQHTGQHSHTNHTGATAWRYTGTQPRTVEATAYHGDVIFLNSQ